MRRIAWLNVVAVILMASGIAIAFVGHDTLRWSPPPIPPSWAAGKHGDALPTASARRGRTRSLPAPMQESRPVSIDIPNIKVRARIISLGLNPDGTLAVPQLTTPFVTSWYDKGATPGERGAATILGHVDSAKVGPAVFYDLGDMRPGNLIFVRLEDGHTAIFQTYSVALYLKTNFPTDTVFGYTRWPTLRLITCGGEFDLQTGHYLGNVVVFATYVGQRLA